MGRISPTPLTVAITRAPAMSYSYIIIIIINKITMNRYNPWFPDRAQQALPLHQARPPAPWGWQCNDDCIRGERIVFWWPNTNTNIIRVPKNYRIRIRILFGFPKLTEYEYEYYSGFQNWPNTNTNIIGLPKNDQIRIWILFGFPKMTKYDYEYYWTL